MDTRCKNCGSPLFYDVKTGNVYCKSCDSIYSDFDSTSTLKTSEKECVFCGAKFSEESPSIITRKCPFCNQKTILDKRLEKYNSFYTLPFRYTYLDAKEIALKNIPITRNRSFIKEMLKDDSSSIYVPFHAYSLFISGKFIWSCSSTEEVEDGEDSEGNTIYRTETKTWYETCYAENYFDNTPIVSSKEKMESFQLTFRTRSVLDIDSDELKRIMPKYFLMSKYLLPNDRIYKETCSDFMQYAYKYLERESRPGDGDYVTDYKLDYNENAPNFEKDVLIPFYYYQNKTNPKYFCYINASSGKVYYKGPINPILLFFIILLIILAIALTALAIIYIRNN